MVAMWAAGARAAGMVVATVGLWEEVAALAEVVPGAAMSVGVIRGVGMETATWAKAVVEAVAPVRVAASLAARVVAVTGAVMVSVSLALGGGARAVVTLAVVVGWARVVMEMAVVEGRVGEAVGLEVEGAAAGRRAMVVLQAAAVVACVAPGAEALAGS